MKFVSAEHKLHIRRLLESRTRIIGPEDARAMRFYQFKPSTAEFFYRHLGRTDITIGDTPHFHLAAALARQSNIAEAESFYTAYLAASWGRERADEFPSRLEAFTAHFKAFQANIKMPLPALTYFSRSMAAFALDGNHRLSFASALGRPIKCEVLPPDLAILLYSRAKDFFNRRYKARPYEGIYFNGAAIIESREHNAPDQFKIIPSNVIREKTILDVGCNFGMNSFLARSAGATSCLGLERSPGLVDLATRFSMFQDTYPSVVFKQCNIGDSSSLPTIGYDTAFVRIKRRNREEIDQLLTVVRKNVKGFVILESEVSAREEQRSSFFQSGLFKSVRELGRTDRSGFKSRKSDSNSLWLLERSPG